jgi:diguanylate cyclase (GGDEF)-like protein
VYIDEVTGLWNQRYFNERLHAEYTRAERSSLPLAIVFVDIDEFDKLALQGTQVRDSVLREIARLLVLTIRGADISGRTDGFLEAARYGRHEFFLILPETGLEGARSVAERLRRAVEATPFPLRAVGRSGHVTISLGVAAKHAGHDAAENLVARADEALRRAKDLGSNHLEVAV